MRNIGLQHRQRKGKPHTIYFTPDQANALQSISRDRHVTKTALVKFAVDQLLERLRDGQLELPLGMDA